MPLTKAEMEAKLAALEDRISLLSQTVDSLENRFEQGVEQWTDWALTARSALAGICKRIDQIHRKLPLPPKSSLPHR